MEANRLRYAIAVDTGGTFTDVTLFDRQTGRNWTAKAPSTPSDPSIGFMDGIASALEQAGLAADELAQVFHGTTVATNLILEGKGAKVALLTTAGFKHVLEIGRQDIPRNANMFDWVKPKRPVPPERVFEIPERLDLDGNVLEPLDQEAVRRIVQDLRAQGIDAIAVCFLHSFTEPKHEQQARAIILEEHPDALVSLSSEVLRVFREYERSMATALNVYVMQAVTQYVANLQERLEGVGAAAPLLIMKSNGGVVSAAEVQRVPVHTALSGPAAGVVGARFVGATAGFDDVIGIDIGGTSADICLVKDGQHTVSGNGRVGGWPLPFPMLDIHTVGTGGGSIASVSSDGALTVGPASAGAVPGPACYGRGGGAATVTDAHLVLGHVPPYLLGGGMRLDLDAARQAIDKHVAQPLGLEIEAAARGIIAISNNDMVGAIRVISIERGHDPRDFALVAFGGAGPLHGVALAELLGTRTVIVPPHPGVLSALGLLVSQLRTDYARTCLQTPPDYDVAQIAATYGELKAEAEAWFERENVPPSARKVSHHASLRYRHQGFELRLPWASDDFSPDATLEAFHRLHEQLYTFAQRDTAVEIVTLHVVAEGHFDRIEPSVWPSGRSVADAVIDHLPVSFDAGCRTVPVYDRMKLGAGTDFSGPALIVQLDTTTLIPEGHRVSCDHFGNLIIAAR